MRPSDEAGCRLTFGAPFLTFCAKKPLVLIVHKAMEQGWLPLRVRFVEARITSVPLANNPDKFRLIQFMMRL